ncbi:unnamed protein product, partial [Sphacelaria rigidula]
MSIELATKVYNRPEAKRFLHQFLHQITGIMLDQHASKFGKFEIGCAKRTLEMSCNVLPILLQDGNTEFMDTVTMLFDPTRTIFSPLKTLWTTAAGSPEHRIKLCQTFMANGGFEVVAKVLDGQAKRLKHLADQRAAAKASVKQKERVAQLAMNDARQAQQAVISLKAASKGGEELEKAQAHAKATLDTARAARAASEKAKSTAAAICAASTPGQPGGAGGAGGQYHVGLNAAGLSIVVGAIAECRLDTSPNAVGVVVKTCTAVMSQVAVLTDEALKKE